MFIFHNRNYISQLYAGFKKDILCHEVAKYKLTPFENLKTIPFVLFNYAFIT